VVGLVLGPIAEDHFRRALQIAQGNYTTFITRPISATILLLALLALILPPLIRWLNARRAEVGSATR
jgi:putative tricarboxylic transport membrane protein